MKTMYVWLGTNHPIKFIHVTDEKIKSFIKWWKSFSLFSSDVYYFEPYYFHKDTITLIKVEDDKE